MSGEAGGGVPAQVRLKLSATSYWPSCSEIVVVVVVVVGGGGGGGEGGILAMLQNS